MSIGKLNPWNWLRKEQDSPESMVPVRRQDPGQGAATAVSPLHSLHRDMDRLFDNFARRFDFPGFMIGSWDDSPPVFLPTIDIAETDKQYAINVELPGVNEKDVRIELTGDTLKISGEKKNEKEEKGKNFHRVERQYGSFQRLLTLPGDADPEAIEAKCKNGVLTITVPRTGPPAPAARQIEVKAG